MFSLLKHVFAFANTFFFCPLSDIMQIFQVFCYCSNVIHGGIFNYFQEFNKKSNSLYTILRSSRLAGSQRAPFLRQFLLRVNFNSFFEVNLFYWLLQMLALISELLVSNPTSLFFYMNRRLQEGC